MKNTPPLLLAAALLFWGWNTNHLILAVVMAVALEAARFLPFKWELTLPELQRIWFLCFLILSGMTVFPGIVWEVWGISIEPMTVVWFLPLIFFPLIVYQCYSINNKIDLRAFSLKLRRKRSKLHSIPIMLNLTYPYVMICITGAGLKPGTSNMFLFYLGTGLLLAWMFWSFRSRRYSPVVWISILTIIFLLGYIGENRVLSRWDQFLARHGSMLRWLRGISQQSDPYHSTTAIGDIGTLKLSNHVVFRVRSETGPHSWLLLREASYNRYQASSWSSGSQVQFVTIPPEADESTWNIQPEVKSSQEGKIPTPDPSQEGKIPTPDPSQEGKIPTPDPSQEGKIPTPDPSQEGKIPTPDPSQEGKIPTPDPSQEGNLRVTVSCYLQNKKAILKLPTGTFRIEHLPVGVMTKNPFGTIQVEEGPGLITYQTVFHSSSWRDGLPTEQDLLIPDEELPGVHQIVDEFHLVADSPVDTLQRIAAFFRDHFSYSLELERQVQELTPLADFLLNTRSGHCEYYATATVLLLRAAGIPARYAVGYAVAGLEEGEWSFVHGRDAHAWTLVYLNGAWYDFDTTPPSWRDLEQASASPFEKLSDLWYRWKFAFSEWRWRERKGGIPRYFGLLVIPLFLFLAWRIVKTLRLKRVTGKLEESPESRLYPGADSAFYVIERILQKREFVREPGEPLTHWIQRIANVLPVVSFHTLQPILLLHYRYRFDPEGLTSDEKTLLQSSVQAWIERYEAEHSDSSTPYH